MEKEMSAQIPPAFGVRRLAAAFHSSPENPRARTGISWSKKETESRRVATFEPQSAIRNPNSAIPS
jgi:hypothetical protein